MTFRGHRPPPLRAVALTAILVGIALLAAAFVFGRAATAIAAIAASWLFVTGLAAGAVAFACAIRLANGRWASEVLPVAAAGVAFLTPSVLVLGGLAAFAPAWMPLGEAATQRFSLARDLVASIALAFTARIAVARGQRGEGRRSAVVYLLVYVATFSLWTVDLVMSLGDWAPSTVLPPLSFMSAFLGGIAWPAVVHARRVGSDSTRRDLGRLLFAFGIFWAYLVWAAYLPTWYGNVPDETGLLIARWHGGWRPVSIAVMVTVFLLPFVLLLPERQRLRRTQVGVCAVSVLVGLLGERFLLIVPAIASRLDLSTAAAMTGAGFLLGGVFAIVVGSAVPPEYNAATKQHDQHGA